jgi:hypothetical protein
MDVFGPGREPDRPRQPSCEFVRLAIDDIEARRLNDKVIENGKPVLANAPADGPVSRTRPPS